MKSQKSSALIAVRIPCELHRTLQDRADREDLTVSQLIRRALRRELDQYVLRRDIKFARQIASQIAQLQEARS